MPGSPPPVPEPPRLRRWQSLPSWSRLLRWLVVVVMPAAGALSLVSVVVGSSAAVDHDLHVVMPPRARPGDPLPVRALVYGELRRAEGPRLLRVPITAQLLDAAGRRRLQRRLGPSLGATRAAVLRVPRGLEGPSALRVVAELEDGERLISRVPLEIAPGAAPLDAVPRPLPPLRQFALGPVRSRAGARPPSSLSARVVGGACVPERPCEVLVHVGKPAASVHVQAYPAVTPLGGSDKPSRETSGLVSLRVITHGPEAELRMIASRAGAEVARRSLRLPIALGSPLLAVSASLTRAPAQPRIALENPQGERGCIVDAFRHERWLRTGHLDDCTVDSALPFAPLSPGIWRLQARTDVFSAAHAASRAVYIEPPGHDGEQAVAHIARTLATRYADERIDLSALRPDAGAGGAERLATYLLARLEEEIVPQPPSVSNYAEALAELQAKRARLRSYAVVALGLCALGVALALLRRGLSASSEARDILAQAGDPHAHSRNRRLRMTLTVLMAVAAVALAFVSVAMYVAIRG